MVLNAFDRALTDSFSNSGGVDLSDFEGDLANVIRGSDNKDRHRLAYDNRTKGRKGMSVLTVFTLFLTLLFIIGAIAYLEPNKTIPQGKYRRLIAKRTYSEYFSSQLPTFLTDFIAGVLGIGSKRANTGDPEGLASSSSESIGSKNKGQGRDDHRSTSEKTLIGMYVHANVTIYFKILISSTAVNRV